jgi:nucleoside-diphosphate-sugar epimerase
MLDAQTHLFVAGLGYVGERLAVRAASELGWRVSGSCRTADKAALIRRRSGIDAYPFDLDDEYVGLNRDGLDALSSATHVLATVPPIADFNRDPLLALHRPVLLRAGTLRWAGYLSTTSVYGDHAGAWVDEASPCNVADGSSAADRLRAEAEWLALHDASDGRLATRVFRLAGIYGPGRSALDTLSRRGAAVAPASPQLDNGTGAIERSQSLSGVAAGAVARTAGNSGAAVPRYVSRIHADCFPHRMLIATDCGLIAPLIRYVSRIHVTDICSALLASMAAAADGARDAAPAVYNVADNEPAPRADVMAYAASLLVASASDASAATDGSADSARAQRRALENKRVSNGRMLAELLPAGLAYPTYREGLRQIALDEVDG